MLKKVVLLFALSGCVSHAQPSHPVQTVPAEGSFHVNDRVEDAREPGRFGTVTVVPDTGHHWFQSPLEVQWDDGDHENWHYDEQVPLLHAVPKQNVP